MKINDFGRRSRPLAFPLRIASWLSLAICPLLLTGCWSKSSNEVVVYSALDREFSEPILEQFEQESGIRVRPLYDVESTKTVGLVTRIIQEQERPVCDVFWNNEILHTLRLQRLGLLEAYLARGAEDFPAGYRSPEHRWYGFAARARVLIVNTELVPKPQWPTSIEDLADPQWKDQVGIAKPLFGTTATHAAVLFAHWGEQRAKEYFRKIRQNARVLSGNKQVATAVGRGQLAFGITDTDDAIIEQEDGRPVTIVFPGQEESGRGALFIPNTVCIIKDGPHGEPARKLVEFLLSPEVEKQLAEGASAQFPVNPQVGVSSRAFPDREIKWMDADFEAAAEQWETASRFLRDEFASVR